MEEKLALKLDTVFLVPKSGHIKKIRVKISHDGKDFPSGISESGSIFKIIAIRDTGEVSNLLTYECFFRDDYDKKCGFDRDLENIPISEGDVLNIRTEKDYNGNIFSGINVSISYLFTFLIELNPL